MDSSMYSLVIKSAGLDVHDLDKLHCSTKSLLLQPEGAYVKMTHAADPSALDNAQCS